MERKQQVRRMIMRGRGKHNDHVQAGKAGQCCMYCQIVGLTEMPTDE